MIKKLRLGNEVSAVWCDSGFGMRGTIAKHTKLVFNTTYGIVTNIKYDKEIHKHFCKAKTLGSKTCKCGILEIAMDSCKDDNKADLCFIWIPSLVSVKVFGKTDWLT